MTDEPKIARLEYPGGSAEFPIVEAVDGPSAAQLARIGGIA